MITKHAEKRVTKPAGWPLLLILAILGGWLGVGNVTVHAQGSCNTVSGYVAIVPTTVCPGANAQVGANTIAVGSPVYTKAWQSSTNGGATWSPVPGVTTSSFTANPLVTTAYRYQITCAAGTFTIGQATVTVPVISAGAAVSLCTGSAGQLGVAPIAGATYSWSPTTGLSNPAIANPTITLTNTTANAVTTTYTLTVSTAQGCNAVRTVPVTVYPLPTASITANGPTTFCAGGSVALVANARLGSTYLWNTGATTASIRATTSGPYTVTVSNAGGCSTTSAPLSVTVDTPLATTGPDVQFCGSGNVQLGALPVPGTTYSWSPSLGLNDPTLANPTVSASNAGAFPLVLTYSLTAVTALGCLASGTVNVTVNPLPFAFVNPVGPVTVCPGGSVLLSAAGPPGSSYRWNTGDTTPDLTITQPGSYFVVVTTPTGCLAASPTTVAVAGTAPPTPTITQTTLPSGMVQLSSSAPAGNRWYLNGQAISGATGPAYTVGSAAANGSYTVVVTSAAGCASAPSAAQAVVVLGTAAAAQAAPMQVHPNPTTGALTVQLPASIGRGITAQLQVLNALGQLVQSEATAVTAPTITLDLGKLAKGIYVVQLQLGAAVLTRRVVLE